MALQAERERVRRERDAALYDMVTGDGYTETEASKLLGGGPGLSPSNVRLVVTFERRIRERTHPE